MNNTTPAALEGRKQEWNITRILVGHDSNHGPIPEIGVLISSIERYNRDHHALLLAQNAEMREALGKLKIALSAPSEALHKQNDTTGNLIDACNSIIEEALCKS